MASFLALPHYRGTDDRARRAHVRPSGGRQAPGLCRRRCGVVLAVFAGLFALAGVVLACLAVYVGRWRGAARAGASLAVLLVAVAWWGLSYALEITYEGPARSRWGDLKYLGIAAVAPAW